MTISEDYWQQLLNLKKDCGNNPNTVGIVGFSEYEHAFFDDSNTPELNSFEVILSTRSLTLKSRTETIIFEQRLYLYFHDSLVEPIRAHLKLYLPLATVSMHHPNDSFVIVHMAQSLDGKVCTNSGQSKWIGNQQNLVHAHRIRALVDGVLVGGNTARSERPSLNVRHVAGPNPSRILLCNSSDSVAELPQIEDMRNFLLCQQSSMTKLDHAALESANFKVICYDDKTKDQGIHEALRCLCKENVHSILLEGGPKTISAFLRINAINWVQLHIAPLVFGSGYSFVSLPEIAKVEQALKLKNVLYTQMGDAMVVTGQLQNLYD